MINPTFLVECLSTNSNVEQSSQHHPANDRDNSVRQNSYSKSDPVTAPFGPAEDDDPTPSEMNAWHAANAAELGELADFFLRASGESFQIDTDVTMLQQLTPQVLSQSQTPPSFSTTTQLTLPHISQRPSQVDDHNVSNNTN